MIGCKEISGIRSKKCKFLLVERQGPKHYLLAYAKAAPCEMQYNTLRLMRLRSMRVPKVIQMADNEILLEYVEGATLYEEVAQGPVFKFAMLATALDKVLQDFCTYNPGKRMGDIDLRGYIVRGSAIYTMDFDCIINGTYAEAVADAICAVLSENIPRELQLPFVRYLYTSAHLSREEMESALNEIMPLCGNLSVGKEELWKAIF